MSRELYIFQHPDPILRAVSRPVSAAEFGSAELRELAENMLATMYAARGIGLAAVQVGDPRCLIVVDVSPSQIDPHVMVNPRIVQADDTQRVRDGCLSVNEGRTVAYTTRAKRIVVDYRDLDGTWKRMKATGLLAAAVQHECDHLEGRLFTDIAEQAIA